MTIFEIGTGYTSIPARMGAATEIVVEQLTIAMLGINQYVKIIDIKDTKRLPTTLPIEEVPVPSFLFNTDTSLGILHKVKRVLYSIALVRKLKNLIKQSTDHIVLHFHNQYNLFFFLKLTPDRLLKNVTIGYTVHSYVWHGKWEDIKDTIKKRYFQEVYCCKHAHAVFTLNPVVTAMLTEHCSIEPSKIRTVINGINTNVYAPLEKSLLKRAFQHFNLNSEKRIVLQVGSVCDRKNQLDTLQKIAPLLKRRKDVVFCYAGGIIDECYQQQILTTATKLGVAHQVRYLGELKPGEELNQLYNIASVAIMNSKSEAFCLVVFEALSSGTPTFVNNAIMHSQPNFNDHACEGIIPMGDNLSNQVEDLIDNHLLYENIAVKGRELVHNSFGWDIAAKQYLEAFTSISTQ